MDLHTKIPVKKFDQMVKYYKMHQCALDFDLGFLKLVVKNKDATSRFHIFILLYTGMMNGTRRTAIFATAAVAIPLLYYPYQHTWEIFTNICAGYYQLFLVKTNR